ncbi:MAG: VOC family protein [Balneolales bacterium]
MIKLNPYLSFNGQCREAMNFYKECFGGELTLQTFQDIMGKPGSGEGGQRIMHSMLENEGLVLMATDMTSPDGFLPGNDMSIALGFDDEESIRSCYTKLLDGGQVLDELKESPWGSLFGVVKDKFGKTWMMDYTIQKSS